MTPFRRVARHARIAAARTARGNFVWRATGVRVRDERIVLDRTVRPFAALDAAGRLPPGFEWCRNHEETDIVGVTTGPTFVEPEYGRLITKSGRLVRRGQVDRSVAPPSSWSFARARVTGRGVVDVPELLSLRTVGEANYYHLLIGLIGGKLRLAEACGLGSDLPVLVSARLASRPVFAELLRRSHLGERRLVLQAHEYVRSEQAHFVDPARYTGGSARYVQDALSVPPGDPDSQRRVLLVRSPSSGRSFDNVDAVVGLARRFGFEAVRTENVTLTEQIELFSQARCVIAAHGAGLANIVFRRDAPLSLLEIFPPDVARPRPAFFAIAAELGFTYDAMLRTTADPDPDGYNRSFPVDLEQFERRIRRMLDEAG